jgi:hypothetical protein
MNIRICLFALLALNGVLLCCCGNLAAQDWLRFRGPQGKGVTETSVPVQWSPDENIKWKTELPGAGVSSPIVVGDKIFVTCYSGYGEDARNVGDKKDLKRHVVCVNHETGKELWSKTIPAADNEDNFSGVGVTAHGYASHTPVSDGKHVFVFLGKSGVIAYDLDGNEKWRKDVGSGSDGKKWGSACSPVLCGDLVVVPALAESRAVFGLNKETGEESWKCKSKAMDNSWTTPVVVESEPGKQQIILGVPDELWAINPKTGKLAWAASGVGGDSFYSSPVINDGVVYASGGGRSGGGTIAVRLGGKKDVTDSHVVWNSSVSSSFGSPVVHGDLIFVLGRNKTLEVLDLESGETLNKVRLQGGGSSGFSSRDYGSPIIAGGKMYYTQGDGKTYVIEPTEACKQIALNELTKDKETFAGTPAVSDGKLFIRSNKHLYCVGK